MIHQYKNNGYNIVLDVYSGAVHVVDDLCYDVIAVLNEPDEEPTGKRRFCIHNMYNKDSNYISIGEMAKINRTTVPTLKLYDSMGLLTPYYVDEHSHIATI